MNLEHKPMTAVVAAAAEVAEGCIRQLEGKQVLVVVLEGCILC